MSKKQNVTSHNARKTVFGWLKRAFLGASKEYAQEELERQQQARANDVEKS